MTKPHPYHPPTFPVLLDHEYKKYANCPRSVPLSLVIYHKKQLLANHDNQTISSLAERGGLYPDELIAIIQDRSYYSMDREEAIKQLNSILSTTKYCMICGDPITSLPITILSSGKTKTYLCNKCVKQLPSNPPSPLTSIGYRVGGSKRIDKK